MSRTRLLQDRRGRDLLALRARIRQRREPIELATLSILSQDTDPKPLFLMSSRRATWPLTGKSVIDITNGDYHRTLDDTEFLNDTMVEYGLRSVVARWPSAQSTRLREPLC